jgi:predicted nucleotidyltransferase
VSTDRHAALIAPACERADDRVRALLLKGSLARGQADERSDVDLVIVTMPSRLRELWANRRDVADRLGRWLRGFVEVPWQAPHTFIGFVSAARGCRVAREFGQVVSAVMAMRVFPRCAPLDPGCHCGVVAGCAARSLV